MNAASNDETGLKKGNGSNPTLQSLAQESATDSNAIQIPSISLPKGGGALKGIDSIFEVNGANGTASFQIPIPVSPGRNGFSPTLALSYNSGGGNSPFGLGWSLNLPSIQRKTDKALPRYREGRKEDVFQFSGVEDLVPYPRENEHEFVRRYRPRIEGTFNKIERITHPGAGTYWKVTTRDNVATIFGRNAQARIADPEDETKIFQWFPELSYDDKGNWIRYHYKQDSNIIGGEVQKNLNIPDRLYEKNRNSGLAPFTNTYLKRITYGNRYAFYVKDEEAYDPSFPSEAEEYFFEVVLDYGEHKEDAPKPNDANKWTYRQDAFSSYRSGFEIRTNRLCKRILVFHHFPNEKQFAGTTEEETFGHNYLVRSLDLSHEAAAINQIPSKPYPPASAEVVYLTALTQTGYIRKPGQQTYSKKSLPPLEFSYQQVEWNNEIQTVERDQWVHAPVGLTNQYQWVDLYGEGISGILAEQAGEWWYKSNLGETDQPGKISFTPAQMVMTKPSPSGLVNGAISIQDLEANGQKQLVVNQEGLRGFFELTNEEDWEGFQTFEHIADIDLQDPHLRMLDLTGDGKPDLLISEEEIFCWYSSAGKRGHHPAEIFTKTLNEEQGPAIVFADSQQTLFLADMVGDGLTDIVRIRNGEVCYWANRGYGKFSAKISMGNAPFFDHPDQFNPRYLHLADVSGTGATDILYLGKNRFSAFLNLSGNAWSDAHSMDPFFPMDDRSKLSVIDLLGSGTSCIVWSSDLPAYADAPMRYIDLMGGKKPHVLIHHKNNMGKESRIHYKHSTHFYLKDKLARTPWQTKLPFPVQVVSKLVVEDKITSLRFTSSYSYHHGYYDHPEREFRGFGRVEQLDTEEYNTYKEFTNSPQQSTKADVFQAPVLTKTWYHTGAYLDRERILDQFQAEYWYNCFAKKYPDETGFEEIALPDAQLSDEVKALVGDEFREALRACKGMVLRKEIFARDAPKKNSSKEEMKRAMKPYSVATHSCFIQLLQARGTRQHGVFLVTEREKLNIQYERDETDPRIAHTLNIEIDDLGNVRESASVVYGRNPIKAEEVFTQLSESVTDFSQEVLGDQPDQQTQLQDAFAHNLKAAEEAQTQTHIIYSRNSFAQYRNKHGEIFPDVDLKHAYRLRMPFETESYEITGLAPMGSMFQVDEFENILDHLPEKEIPYHAAPGEGLHIRLIEHIKNRYLKDDLNKHDWGFFDTLGLNYQSYQLAYSPELLKEIFVNQDGPLKAGGKQVNEWMESEGKFSKIGGNWWIRSGITHFKAEDESETLSDVRARFYSPIAFEDPFGAKTQVVYDVESFASDRRNDDGYYIFISQTTDAIGNTAKVDIFNFRSLSPSRMIDINSNPTSVLLDELGLVKALAVEGNGYIENGSFQLEKADELTGLTAYSTEFESEARDEFWASGDETSTDTERLRNAANGLLQQATVRFVYDFDTYKRIADHNAPFIEKKAFDKLIPLRPIVAASISREEHAAQNPSGNLQFRFEYTGGLGQVTMSKMQAEPGKASYMEEGERKEKDTGNELRWIGSGRTVLNNKGNPVKQYEPYFSTNFLYENETALVECGVSPEMYYDPLGRQIKTTFPDGTLNRVEFDAWQKRTFDRNDMVLEPESHWHQHRTNPAHKDYIDAPAENQAALQAEKHAHTPSALLMDAMGRPVLSIAHNGEDAQNKLKLYTTFIELDIEGNTRSVIDARGNAVMRYQYDILGHRIYQNSMDAGERWMLNNAMRNPVFKWDSRGHVFHFSYDQLQRLVSTRVHGGDRLDEHQVSIPLDHVFDRIRYGELEPDAARLNLRGEIAVHYDTAGSIQNHSFDFKGNLLENSRMFLADYKQVPNWKENALQHPELEPDSYPTRMEYDALNRVVKTTTPDQSITESLFDKTGLLEQIKVTQPGHTTQFFVKNIDYNARGQREQIVYGDGSGADLATTTYSYDKHTFRLKHLQTTKANGHLVQDLHYTYDPVGNITEVDDKAIPDAFFNNERIAGKNTYAYDALYRLQSGHGREHAGQALNVKNCDNWNDLPFLQQYDPGNPMTWRTYTQAYRYDPAGNILETDHDANGGNWVRTYTYEAGTNRLAKTQIAGERYVYDHHLSHGLITRLPHLPVMEWNFKDELQKTATQRDCTGKEPETTYYVYDSQGHRVRKVTEKRGGGKKEERCYLGEVELYKLHTGEHNGLTRTSLHIMDDTRRIALIDSRNEVNDGTDKRTIRFQFGNHLGSAAWEMDDSGVIISYEEYHPFGSTAYQAVNKQVKSASKRYRYTGKERDEETGLYYYGARYYLCWLGRWSAPDPAGLVDGGNVYGYVKNNPVRFLDPNGLKAIVKLPEYSDDIRDEKGRLRRVEFYFEEEDDKKKKKKRKRGRRKGKKRGKRGRRRKPKNGTAKQAESGRKGGQKGNGSAGNGLGEKGNPSPGNGKGTGTGNGKGNGNGTQEGTGSSIHFPDLGITIPGVAGQLGVTREYLKEVALWGHTLGVDVNKAEIYERAKELEKEKDAEEKPNYKHPNDALDQAMLEAFARSKGVPEEKVLRGFSTRSNVNKVLGTAQALGRQEEYEAAFEPTVDRIVEEGGSGPGIERAVNEEVARNLDTAKKAMLLFEPNDQMMDDFTQWPVSPKKKSDN